MIVVVGGGISGLAAAYEAKRAGRQVLLLEAGPRCGGILETSRVELPGWGELTLELGAESMLLAKPHGRVLCEELGLESVTTVQRYRGTRILRDGKLRRIPDGLRLMAPGKLLPFLRSDVIGPWGKLRMLADFFIPPSRNDDDESVASFVRRRFGQECLDRLAQPMLAGIYTADPEQLSLLATQPDFRQLERETGSVIRSLMRRNTADNAGPRYGLFFSLPGGLQELTDRLVQELGDVVQTNSPVEAVTSTHVRAAGRTIKATHVILALPAWQSARLLEGELAALLAEIPYSSAATVNLVYPLDALARETDAFGFVVPKIEKRDILACTYSHRKYPGRCPAGLAVLRAYLGGQQNEEAMAWSDSEMVERSHRELSDILGIRSRPLLSLVGRCARSMPVYRVGHGARAAAIRKKLEAYPHLSLLGNGLSGVGIPDCIGNARELVRNLL